MVPFSHMSTPFNVKENLIAMLGVQALPEEKRVELLNMATELVEKRVFVRLIEGLSDADAAEAEKFADKPEEFIAFVASKGPSIETLVQEEVAKVRDELKADTDALELA